MSDIHTLWQQAQSALRLGQPMQAVGFLRQLLAAPGDLGDGWGDAANMARKLGDLHVARAASAKYSDAAPQDETRMLRFIDDLAQSGEVEQAYGTNRRLLKNRPNNPAVLYSLGNLAAQTGKLEDAERAFRMALQKKPDLTIAWEQLSFLKRLGPQDVEAMDALAIGLDGAPMQVSAPLYYALGEAARQSGDAAAAWRWWSKGAQAVRPDNLSQSIDKMHRQTSDILTDATAEFFETLAHDGGAPTDRPVFILGMPRSGTTLLDQILATHSRVGGGGELPLMRLATWPLGDHTTREIEAFARNSQGGWSRLGNGYEGLMKERFRDLSPRMTDKTLNLHRWLGSVQMMLPNAKFIYLRRAPEDVALSCFRHRFTSGHAWTYNLEDIAAYMRDYESLMAHWQSLFPETILTLDYADLVLTPEPHVKKLCEFIGVPYESEMQFFHENTRPVTSASLAQVRQPLNYAGLQAAKPYAEFLEPFRKAYEQG